jgi:hypothetical protein
MDTIRQPTEKLRITNMGKTLYITPPSLLRWQPSGERTDILFLDMEPDFLDEKTIRIDLNIVFRPIPVKRGWVQTKDYYVGSTGARVVFEAIDGEVKNYTRAAAITIDYENTYKRSRKTEVKLSPKLEGAADTKVEFGEISFGKDVERSFTSKFSGSERMLSDINLGHGVEWELTLPEGQAIRDYLIGNLFLYVECSWDHDPKRGSIKLRPSNVLFFDENRRVIADPTKALLMRFALYKLGTKLNRDELTIDFEETK